MRFIGFVLLVAAAAFPAQGAVYKWIDAQGGTQYSDRPPPPNARQVEEQKIVKNTIGTAGAPFAVQEAAKRNPVTLWMNDCGDLCNRARDYLAKRGIPHTVRNPARLDEQGAWKNASGGDNSIPLLVIGTTRTIKGFNESTWSAAIDAAGYPRGAPAITPPAIPPAAYSPPGSPQAAAPAAAPAPPAK